MAGALALLLPATAAAHSVPSTKAEQQAGLRGQRHHLKRAQWHHRGAVRHCRRALTATQDCRRHFARYKANQRRLRVLERRLTPRIPAYPWLWLADCESGDGPRAPGPPFHIWWGYHGDYEGAFNFVHSTWLRNGGGRYAHHSYDATPYQQYLIARHTVVHEGWESFPACSIAIGVR